MKDMTRWDTTGRKIVESYLVVVLMKTTDQC